MKKHIISILLVMAIILSMTACVAEGNTEEATKQVTPITASTEPQESTRETIAKVTEIDYEIEAISFDTIREMTYEDFSEYFAKLVLISKEKDLSIDEMELVGKNFSKIWSSIQYKYIDLTDLDFEEFKRQASEAFDYVYKQAESKGVPLEVIYQWEELPVAYILCKYFSSSNFADPEYAMGYAIWDLTEEEVIQLAECFFENPKMNTNASVPEFIIRCDYDNSITEKAWEHLEELSNYNLRKYGSDQTYVLCSSLLRTMHSRSGEFSNSKYMDRLLKIEKNILENPNFDFYWKYILFVYAYGGDTPEDEAVTGLAVDMLKELAQNPDPIMEEQLRNLTYDIDIEIGDEILAILDKKS